MRDASMGKTNLVANLDPPPHLGVLHKTCLVSKLQCSLPICQLSSEQSGRVSVEYRWAGNSCSSLSQA